jgi:hypothetical protein
MLNPEPELPKEMKSSPEEGWGQKRTESGEQLRQ